MNAKGKIVAFAVGSVLAAGSAATMIYLQKEEIKQNEAESARLEDEIAKARALLKQTPDLIKEVIIQRETDEVIREILSNEEDVNNLVRTLHSFAEASGIAITQLKPQRQVTGSRRKEDFDRVAYSLTFDATAWELLDFLDRVETHPRFMSVTSFTLSAARRASFSNGVEPRHRLQLDLETYVYQPTSGGKEVKIDAYDHKKELLIAEIARRASDLRIPNYSYSGPRGRRDPWVDPRMPVDSGPDGPDIPTQIALVEELVARVQKTLGFREDMQNAETIIEEMKASALFEEELAHIEEEVRRIREDEILSFVSAERQFAVEVEAVVVELREWSDNERKNLGPSRDELIHTRDSIARHVERQEYELARGVFEGLEPRFRNVPLADLERQEIISQMRSIDQTLEKVLAFEAIEIDIGGVALYEGRRPVALINGHPVAEGELLSDELVVRNIRSDQIEFAFRGLVLARPVEGSPPSPR